MKRLAILLTLIIILAIPAGSVMAAPPFDIVVEEGETYEGDVTVFGDEMELKAGGVVDGDVTVFGGNADIAGTINGDLAIFGGNVTLSGIVDGDLVTFGGSVEITEDAAVIGDCVVLGGAMDDSSAGASCATIGGEFILPGFFGGRILTPDVPEPPIPPAQPSPPTAPSTPSFAAQFGASVLNLGGVLGRALLMGFIAFLTAVFMPSQLQRVSDVVRRKPVASGAVGLLTVIAGPSLLVLLVLLSVLLTFVCVGILGYPIVIVLAFILVAAAIFGWVAVGNLLGEAIIDLFKTKSRSLALTATAGTIVMTLVLGLLSLPRFFPGEGVVAFVFLCLGLGATALTQFGTKLYPPADDVPPSKFEATQAAAGENPA